MIEALWRRWYVVVVGGLLLVAVLGLEWRSTGVYWTRFDVQFAPPTTLNPNSLAYANDTLAATAAVVTMKFNGHTMPPGPSSPAATIVGEGVRQGSSVRVTDYGKQWSRDFRPAVDVQIVDPDPAAVTARSEEITRRLAQILAEQQAEVGAPQRVRISATRIPDEPPIYYQAGPRSRALGATLLAGTGGVATVAVLYDGWALRRRERRSAAATEEREPILAGAGR